MRGDGRGAPYWIPFSLTVVLLGGLTAAFVLVVLPNRYVFQAGLQASGASFPARGIPFTSPELVLQEPRWVPPAAPPEPEPLEVEPIPGPAERLWARVVPLLRSGEPALALPHFAAYLADHPDDMPVWLEYGIALARAGEGDDAEAAFRRVAHATDDLRPRLEWARLLRDREEWGRAVSLYRELLEEHPDDHGLRLELARVLWAANRPEDADRVARGVPSGVEERGAADELRERLAAATEPPPVAAPGPAEPADPLALAWEDVWAGQVARLDSLYRADREAALHDPDRLLEWANVFQYGAEDPARALALLVKRMEREPRAPELELRVARLYLWTGQEARAAEALDRLLVGHPDQAQAWALLGDVRRWEGARPEAARAYRRALELEPGEPRAVEGLRALSDARERAVDFREDPGFGPTLTFLRDSDGFRRLEVAARGGLVQGGRDGASARSGYRRVEGIRPDGSAGREHGGFGELELSRWWREGTVRGSVALGAEQLGSTGAEPLLGARVEARGLASWDLEAEYRHGRAYPLVSTLESIDPLIRADRIAVAVEGGPRGGWNVTADAEAVSLRGGAGEVWRLAAGLGASTEVTGALRLGLVARVLGFSDAAPAPLDRRSYWDPELFSTLQVPVEIRAGRGPGWDVHVRLGPGVGLVRERETEGSFWKPQFEGLVGTRYTGGRTSLDARLFTTRGREGEYRAFGFGLGLTVRP